MASTVSAATLARRAARVPGVTFAIAASSFSRMSVTVDTEYASRVEVYGYGTDWEVIVYRVADAETTEAAGHPVRTLLTDRDGIPVKGTAMDAIRFGIAYGIGHAEGSAQPVA